jgi:hypothetical protein
VGPHRAKNAGREIGDAHNPVIELLRDYFNVNIHDSTQSIRERMTGKVLALDASLQDTISPMLDLLDALDHDDPFRSLDKPRSVKLAQCFEFLGSHQLSPRSERIRVEHWIHHHPCRKALTAVQAPPPPRLQPAAMSVMALDVV